MLLVRCHSFPVCHIVSGADGTVALTLHFLAAAHGLGVSVCKEHLATLIGLEGVHVLLCGVLRFVFRCFHFELLHCL